MIGIAIADEGSPGNEEVFGVEGITTGNVERYFEIMAEAIAARGGIAGRAVRYSIYRFSTAEGAQFSTLEQAACTHWAQDDRAFVVGFTATDNFLGCAEDNGMVAFGDTLVVGDDATFAGFPHFLRPQRDEPHTPAAAAARGARPRRATSTTPASSWAWSCSTPRRRGGRWRARCSAALAALGVEVASVQRSRPVQSTTTSAG